MSEQNELVKKRGIIKANLTRFINYMNSLITPIDITSATQLKGRIERIEITLEQFNEVQSNIELMEKDNSNDIEHDGERNKFENDYYSNITKGKLLINPFFQSSSSGSSDSYSHNLNNNVKLPTIHLPTFTGNSEKWMEFYDTFNTLIHNNSLLSDIQKFHYLKSSLKYDAAATIQSLESSAASYTIAWELLKERYQNKRLTIHNHVKALFNLKSITKECHSDLRTILDRSLNHLRALKVLNQPTEHWDTLLIYMVNSKLDQNTRREWEFYKISGEIPTFVEFSSFLRERCDILETIHATSSKTNVKHSNQKPTEDIKYRSRNYLVSNNNIITCIMCKGFHPIYNCSEFLKLSVEKRLSEAKSLYLCTNCLRRGHSCKDCKSSTCRKCQGKHNTLLHVDSVENSPVSSERVLASSISNPANTECSNQILLSTACVKIYDNNGKDYNCRVLLDSGSQSNFITHRMCELLNLKKETINSSVTGISQSALSIKFKIDAQIRSICDTFQTKIQCLVLDKITDKLPELTFDKSILEIPKNLSLADPKFHKTGSIDMLIGAQLFWQLLSIGQIRLGENRPLLQKTRLGWIISGPIPVTSTSSIKTHCSIENLNSQLKKFWEIEEFNDTQMSPTDQYCEDFFVKTTKRTDEGRFVVKIPLLADIKVLGESKQPAIKR